MNWQGAINLNREALQRILAALFTMAGIKPGGTHLPRAARLNLLRVLRPAESALRRLIVIAARGIAAKYRMRPAPDFAKLTDRKNHVPNFALFDRRKRFAGTRNALPPHKGVPRLTIWGVSQPAPVPDAPVPHDPSKRLALRLKALHYALEDLPKQARRLARHLARRATLPAGPRRVGPMRPGLPPAYKKRPTHEVDFVLRECHALAVQAREAPT